MQRFKPTFVRKESAFVFFILLLVQALFSTTVHSDQDNILSALVWGCSVTLVSQLIYTTISSFKYLKFLLSFMSGSLDDNGAAKAKSKYALSASGLACDSSYFADDDSGKKYPLSRGGLWRILYPLSSGIFMLFLFSPLFDTSCACLLSFGFMLRSAYVEFVRGNRYHRPITRRVLFCIVTLSGVFCCIFMFVLAYSTGVLVTNEKAKFSKDYVHAQSIEAIVDLGNSSLPSEVAMAPEQDIISKFVSKIKVTNPRVVQYVRWTMDSYARRMVPVWLLAFSTPFLICYLPEHTTSLFVLETVHTSVSFFAAVTMCAVAVVLDRQPFLLLHTSTAGGAAYLLLSPVLMWGLIFRVFEYQRRRSFCVPACVILSVSFVKHCSQHGSLLKDKFFKDVAIVTGIVTAFFALFTFAFVRLENTAIVLEKWGSADEELSLENSQTQLDNFSIEDPEDEDNGNRSMNMGDVASSEAIKRVLQEARDDIKAAKSLIDETVTEDDAEKNST